MQETQVLKDAVEVLERETKSLNAKNRTLENDIERLSNMIEFTSGERRVSVLSNVLLVLPICVCVLKFRNAISTPKVSSCFNVKHCF